MNSLNLGQRKIGPSEEIFIIAEIGLNHNLNIDMAMQLIEVAAESGCSAAKFQTFTADQVYVNDVKTGNYNLMGKSIPIYELHKNLEMPPEWVPKLMSKCNSLGIEFFSAPIGLKSLELLVRNRNKLIKVSSYECTNLPFLREIAKKRIPTIISTGACTIKEIASAVEIFESEKCEFALLHCLTIYPAEFHLVNFSAMRTLKQAFNVPVGFSNNGFINKSGEIDFKVIPSEAAKSGADLFEIHITLDRGLPGPDHGFAVEPLELTELVKSMKEIRRNLQSGTPYELDPILQGISCKKTLPEELYIRNFAFKCIFAQRDILPGERLTTKNTSVLRPGEATRGIEPEFYELLTKIATAKLFIKKNDPITWDKIIE